MANTQRGHVDLKAGETSYKLVFSINALCELEEETGLSVNQLAAEMGGDNVKLKLLRVLLWGALRDHHEDVTIKGAGDIAGLAGMAEVGDAIGKAFNLAFPEVKETAGSRPPKAGRGGRG
jgi:hypothetical protein